MLLGLLGLMPTLVMVGAVLRITTLVSVNGPSEMPSFGVTRTVQVSFLVVALSGTVAVL